MRCSGCVVLARRLMVAASFLLVQVAPLLLPAAPVHAATGETPRTRVDDPGSIEDNSFLVEEAYNQEEGVVQHISGLLLDRANNTWAYSFTQEWPVRGQAHQLSYTLIAERPADDTGASGIGDCALNYRWMALGAGGGRIAFAPRVSLLFATGNSDEGRGDGGPGLQFNLPLSIQAGRSVVLHSNIGALHVRRGRNEAGESADLDAAWAGQSLIWLARPAFNVMFETLWTRSETIVGDGSTDRRTSLILSPGARFAINRPSGLQIVPGIAFPIELWDDEVENAVLLYLSFEHPFGSAAHDRE